MTSSTMAGTVNTGFYQQMQVLPSQLLTLVCGTNADIQLRNEEEITL